MLLDTIFFLAFVNDIIIETNQFYVTDFFVPGKVKFLSELIEDPPLTSPFLH